MIDDARPIEGKPGPAGLLSFGSNLLGESPGKRTLSGYS